MSSKVDVETPIAGSWLATEPGRHYLTVEARLLSGPVERELDNNSESIPLNAEATRFSPTYRRARSVWIQSIPRSGDPVTLTAEITNLGWAPASDFDVYFLAEEDPAPPLLASRSVPQPAAPLVLAVVNVPFLDPEETVEVEATIASLDRPEITVWVHVDPTGAVAKVEAPSILGKRIAAVDAAELCKTDQTTWFSVGTQLAQQWLGRTHRQPGSRPERSLDDLRSLPWRWCMAISEWGCLDPSDRSDADVEDRRDGHGPGRFEHPLRRQ